MSAYGGDFCLRFRGLLPLHALGTPMGEELPPLRDHLEGCAACRRELEDLCEALALLPFALEPVRPLPQTWQRLREQIELGPPAPAVAASSFRPRSGGMTLSQAAPAPVTQRRWGALALGATICAAMGLGAIALREHRLRVSGEQQVALLRARLEDAEARAHSQALRLAEAEGRLRFLFARSMQLVPLTPPSETEAEASGRILWDQERRAWLFLAFRLPPPPADRDYQLWFLVKGPGGNRPRSAGLARPLPTGDLELSVQIPPDIGDIVAAALTLERKGGSDRPTTDPVLYGQF
ncbi:MAG: anti-sigma factor [Myxococcales bacterium]|nr:anti-sigma factor [Myxococcota bacterium]MDW8281531.1 anti-sigma factor [Myxococcales bacterium]